MRKRVCGLAAVLVAVLGLLPGVASGSFEPGWPLEVPAPVVLGFGESYTAPDGTTFVHRGVDLAASSGSVVCGVLPGTVTFVGRVPAGEGATILAVTVESGDVRLTYSPLSEIYVGTGEDLDTGGTLGTLAETGDRSHPEPHLHLSVRRETLYVDPMPFLLAPVEDESDQPPAPAPEVPAPAPAPEVPAPAPAPEVPAPAPAPEVPAPAPEVPVPAPAPQLPQPSLAPAPVHVLPQPATGDPAPTLADILSQSVVGARAPAPTPVHSIRVTTLSPHLSIWPEAAIPSLPVSEFDSEQPMPAAPSSSAGAAEPDPAGMRSHLAVASSVRVSRPDAMLPKPARAALAVDRRERIAAGDALPVGGIAAAAAVLAAALLWPLWRATPRLSVPVIPEREDVAAVVSR